MKDVEQFYLDTVLPALQAYLLDFRLVAASWPKFIDRSPRAGGPVAAGWQKIRQDVPISGSSTTRGAINEGWHLPAAQPRHEQLARLILFAKYQKRCGGAFRLLCVDPVNVELFAGNLPLGDLFRPPTERSILL